MTSELYNTIIAAIFNGETIGKTLEFHGVEPKSFYRFIDIDPAYRLEYTRALEDRTDIMADQIVDIADNETDAARARNRIDSRKWLVSKRNAKQYGDKLDINVTKTVDINAALEAGMKRALPIRDLDSIDDAQVIDTKQLSDDSPTDCVPVNQNERDDKHSK